MRVPVIHGEMVALRPIEARDADAIRDLVEERHRTAVVTDFMDAGSLAEVLRSEGPLPPKTAVALVDHGRAQPDSTVVFATPVGSVEIRVTRDASGASAAFTSVAPSVRALAGRDLAAILDLLGLSNAELDPALPPRIADARPSFFAPLATFAHASGLPWSASAMALCSFETARPPRLTGGSSQVRADFS